MNHLGNTYYMDLHELGFHLREHFIAHAIMNSYNDNWVPSVENLLCVCPCIKCIAYVSSPWGRGFYYSTESETHTGVESSPNDKQPAMVATETGS